jgi:probable rRNA maturation factor
MSPPDAPSAPPPRGGRSQRTGEAGSAAATGLPALELDLQFGEFSGLAAHRSVLRLPRVKRWMQMALKYPAEITVRIVGKEEAQALNLQYRGKDYATNVLTFDYQRAPVVQADLVLCGPVVAREAWMMDRTLDAYYAHLLVHGTLHAQGYDHETNERDALEMEALEVLLVQALGYPNPY